MAKNFVSILILVFLVVGIVSVVKLLKYNFSTLSKNKELENKILTTQLQLKEEQLSYLKMQIHPHFLFNTLNTIYGFALQQSKHTPGIILKLSNLLDYILYQVTKPRVSLSEEVMHIKEYIDLERIRFHETLRVNFNATKINKDLQIAPMLLIPFVENAFKHGNLVNGTLKIDIDIAVKGMQLDFSIKNTVIDHSSLKKQKGIGLENIKKRLVLHYENKYHLEIKRQENWFIVNLMILDLNPRDYAKNNPMFNR